MTSRSGARYLPITHALSARDILPPTTMQRLSPSLPPQNVLSIEQLHLGGGHGGAGGSAGVEGGGGGLGQGASMNIFAETAVFGTPTDRNLVAKANFEEVEDVSCPPPSPYFQGRQDILAQLGHFFGETKDKGQTVVLLHGLGGIGKTQIALKFIEEYGSQ
ncbi:hypothetical protein HMN09_00209400 [Mycena chlorophos]|uniref:NB-ARC domain-containing protein n=1 Tax=Mycena chlorophos TaxID=658473 RepID=A0A8H6TLQ4_MYCCL|nr:hypothetical protein HMN09_00209400 [Mycena chlorophos]